MLLWGQGKVCHPSRGQGARTPGCACSTVHPGTSQTLEVLAEEQPWLELIVGPVWALQGGGGPQTQGAKGHQGASQRLHVFQGPGQTDGSDFPKVQTLCVLFSLSEVGYRRFGVPQGGYCLHLVDVVQC